MSDDDTSDMSEATGERSFALSQRTVVKFDDTALPPGEYDGILRGADARVETPGPDSSGVAYVSVPIEYLNTASKDNGNRNRTRRLRLFLSLAPGKDGVANIDRGGGIVDLAKEGLGMDELAGVGIVKVRTNPTKDNPEGKVVEAMSAQDVKRWLQEHDGSQVRFLVKHERERGQMDAKTKKTAFTVRDKVDHFIRQVDAAESPWAAPSEPEQELKLEATLDSKPKRARGKK